MLAHGELLLVLLRSVETPPGCFRHQQLEQPESLGWPIWNFFKPVAKSFLVIKCCGTVVAFFLVF